VFLCAFDLLELDGEDWRPRPLGKAKLRKLLTGARAGVQFNEHLEGDGAANFAHACKLGCEGIVSKHREHPYRSGPSNRACCGSRIGRRTCPTISLPPAA
jgi:bifunctional non-homologous end joining protein LigD